MVAAPSAAWAHGGAAASAESDAWRALVLAALILCHWLYSRGAARLRRRAEPDAARLGPAHRLAFVAGEFALLLALVSPIDDGADTTLSMHMVQHLLLILAAPVLLLCGRPGLAFAWSLPHAPRLARGYRRAIAVVGRPLPAAGLHALALWFWHLPGPFEAALRYEALHAAEHACFFGTALLFWHAMLAARRRRRLIPAAVLALLVTIIQGGMLSAWLTLAPEPLFASYQATAPSGGLPPLEDQQLAGLVMWVPAGLAYLAFALALVGRFIDRPRYGKLAK